MSEREQWGTRIGFILAAVGSAVGLGNVWRFPFQVGEQGGATFLLMYVAIILIIGLPAMLVEFTIGRRSQRNPIDAFEKLGHREWSFVGILAVITGFIILAYYSVVAGWTIRYTGASITGAYFDDPAGYFGEVSFGIEALGFHAVFMVIAVGIVAFGIKRGIEACTKILVPAIIVLLLGLIVFGLTLEGAGEGLTYYLTPEFDALRDNWMELLPSAAGQALFTLSLGMGAMITYSSYIADDDNLVVDSGWIVGFNTAIALMAGLVIFPVLFSVGVDPADPGPGALFVGFGEAIAEAPASELIGAFFFGTVVIAAVSSGISILEVIVSFVIDHFEVDRIPATIGVGVIVFIVGIPTAFDGSILDLYDGVVAEVLLPLGMGLLVLFAGWFFTDAKDELLKGLGPATRDWLPTVWLWHIRTVILAVAVLVLILSSGGAYETLMEILEATE